MNNLLCRVLCDGCSKFKGKIETSGSMHGVDFVTFKSQKQYKIVDNPNITWDEVMKIRENFISAYVPKFGKYEIEKFVGHKMMEALFITKDTTGLLNSQLLCDDTPYNITRISAERLKYELLKCFDIVKNEEESNHNVINLMFKWKPYYELEE